MLESFGESPKACVTNSSRPPEKLKGKENPDLPLVCSNYWPPNVTLSLCRIVLSQISSIGEPRKYLRAYLFLAALPDGSWLDTLA